MLLITSIPMLFSSSSKMTAIDNTTMSYEYANTGNGSAEGEDLALIVTPQTNTTLKMDHPNKINERYSD